MTKKRREIDAFWLLISGSVYPFIRSWLKDQSPEHYQKAEKMLSTEFTSESANKFFIEMPRKLLSGITAYLGILGIPMMVHRGQFVEMTPQRMKEQGEQKIQMIKMRGVRFTSATYTYLKGLENGELKNDEWETIKNQSEQKQTVWSKTYLIKHPALIAGLLKHENEISKVEGFLQYEAMQKKLITEMVANNRTLRGVLEEDDPGLLIQWDERACKTCGSVKTQWAERVLNTCDDVLAYLKSDNITGEKNGASG